MRLLWMTASGLDLHQLIPVSEVLDVFVVLVPLGEF